MNQKTKIRRNGYELGFRFYQSRRAWIAIGIIAIILTVRGAARKKKGEDGNTDYALEGMSLGMCLGMLSWTAIGDNIGIGISLGALIGLAIGMCITKKKKEEKT